MMEGMEVRISNNIETTEKFHHLDDEEIMMSMRGKIFKIQRVIGKDSILVNDFYWHPSDLILIVEERKDIIKKEPVLYNVNNLDL